MPSDNESCLLPKLKYHLALSPSEEALWLQLERDPRSFARDHLLRQAGDPIEKFHIVRSGWLYSFTTVDDGRRQILKIHLPGDVVDLADLPLANAAHSIRCASPAVLCSFDRDDLDMIFTRAPRMAALLFSIMTMDELALLNRIQAIGRLSAYDRLAHFLAEIAARLSVVQGSSVTSFDMPLTQTEIGDALGLTNVYVSKTIARLESDGLLERRGGRVILPRPERLRVEGDFIDPTQRIDTSWFPTTTVRA